MSYPRINYLTPTTGVLSPEQIWNNFCSKLRSNPISSFGSETNRSAKGIEANAKMIENAYGGGKQNTQPLPLIVYFAMNPQGFYNLPNWMGTMGKNPRLLQRILGNPDSYLQEITWEEWKRYDVHLPKEGALANPLKKQDHDVLKKTIDYLSGIFSGFPEFFIKGSDTLEDKIAASLIPSLSILNDYFAKGQNATALVASLQLKAKEFPVITSLTPEVLELIKEMAERKLTVTIFQPSVDKDSKLLDWDKRTKNLTPHMLCAGFLKLAHEYESVSSFKYLFGSSSESLNIEIEDWIYGLKPINMVTRKERAYEDAIRFAAMKKHELEIAKSTQLVDESVE